MFNVQDYGATGDGTTDDTAAIQATIAAAGNSAGGQGSIVFFPEGTYKFTQLTFHPSSTVYYSNVSLHGSGRYATILMSTSTNALAIDNTSSYSVVQDLTIRCAGTPTSGHTLLRMSGADNVIQRVVFDNFYVGAQIHGTSMRDCVLDNGVTNSTAVLLRDSIECLCDRVFIYVRANMNAGFHVESFAGDPPDTNRFINCSVVGHLGIGLAACFKQTRGTNGGIPRWTRIISCSFECDANGASVHAVDIQSAEDLVITSCYVLGGADGISVTGPSSAYLKTISVLGTIVFGAGRRGISHDPDDASRPVPLVVSNCQVVGNDQINTAAPGVYLGGNSRGFQMHGGASGRERGSTATPTQTYGIEASVNARDFSIDLASIDLGGNLVASSTGLSPTVASAATIAPWARVHHVTGTAVISQITLPQFFTGPITLIPDGLWSTATGGNIALATSAVIGRGLVLTFDSDTALWYPSY
jgi:hypothetical protein